MKPRQNLALALAILGLMVAIAAPLVPGGIRLVVNQPPGAGHVTELIATADGDVLAGTEAGEVWRFRDGRWTAEGLDLGGHPVMALLDSPGRPPVGTAAGLFYAPAGAPKLAERVSSLLETDQGLLAGTASGVRLLANGGWREPGPRANIYSLFHQRLGDGHWLHAGTVDGGVLSTPAGDAGAVWQPNNQGLPGGAKVFSFAGTGNGALLAGTDKGLFWQPGPGQPWQSLFPGLDGKRVLALHLAADNELKGARRLWIGGDDGLYSLAIVEQGDGLVAQGGLQAVEVAANQPALGISGIVSTGDRLMISAGEVYAYGQTRMPGWYWISLAGVVLILLAGWLITRSV